MKTKNHFWRVCMPYCLRPLGDNHVILNRDYRPLGYIRDFILPEEEYQELLEKHSIHIPSLKQLQKLHWGETREDGYIYLHSGALIDEKDWSAYLEKVRLLAQLAIEI